MLGKDDWEIVGVILRSFGCFWGRVLLMVDLNVGGGVGEKLGIGVVFVFIFFKLV